MPGTFRIGQLVAPVDHIGPVDLFSEPGAGISHKARKTGRIEPNNVCLVVAIEGADMGNVYVLSPHGFGWTFGAFLEVL